MNKIWFGLSVALLFAVGVPTAIGAEASASSSAGQEVAASGNVKRSEQPAMGLRTPAYVLNTQADWAALLPPPPAADSAAQHRELQAVLDAQAAARQANRVERAVEDAELSCFRFSDVLGAAMDAEHLPVTAKFLRDGAGDSAGGTSSVKQYWERPRPYVVSDKVQRWADVAPDFEKKMKEKEAAERAAGKTPPRDRLNLQRPEDDPNLTPEEKAKRIAKRQREMDYSSYPSGHAVFGTLCGILLSQMVPERRVELFARAQEYAQSRVVVGAHFPSDIESGRVLATVIAALMEQNAAFQRDFYAARAELRAALGLPLQPPQPEKKKEE